MPTTPLLVIGTIGTGIFLSAYLVGQYARKKHPDTFQKYQKTILPFCFLFLFVHFTFYGTMLNKPYASIFILLGASFFGTGSITLLTRDEMKQNRFSMKQLVIFFTIFAFTLGIRSAIHMPPS